MLTGLINALIRGLGSLSRFVGMLPPSPFQMLQSIIPENPAAQVILWIVPVAEALALFQLWLTAIFTYYLVKVPLRWIKLLQG